MESTPWWQGAIPHQSIREGNVNEALFEAKLGDAVRDRGPDEYRDAEIFFGKTFLTTGLRQLLLDILHTVSGERAANAVVNLKTSFGGGKTHTELAIYHLFQHPDAALRVPAIRELVQAAGLEKPPPCRVAVLPCTRIDPTGRVTEDGVHIRTLWGEMAYLLGGKEAFAEVATADERLVSPGEDRLEAVLRLAGPSIILFDETLHYVDKVSTLEGAEGDLAKQTVAFLRELTGVVDAMRHNMLVVSLTASRVDQLSNNAQSWLDRMEQHINRLARPCTPIEGAEIQQVVRQRLFDTVDEATAEGVTADYFQLLVGAPGVPGQYMDAAYRERMRRSYPFHPELITVLYERWGAKPGFQLTRGTLRILALALQELWKQRDDAAPALIQMGHVPMTEPRIRSMVRDIAGDPSWESVVGSDIAAAGASGQKAKAELLDAERNDGRALARELATAILLYSIGGGEHPEAKRYELRVACTRPDVGEAEWDDLLDLFRRRFFYLYYDEAKYQFRKEPNVTSLHHTYLVNIIGQRSEIDAHVDKLMKDKALGASNPAQGFAQVFYLPESGVDRDDDQLKLVVLGFDAQMFGDQPSEAARSTALGILERHGAMMRSHRNTLVFCAPGAEGVQAAHSAVADYLSWRTIQRNQTDWDRIGGVQQAQVKEALDTASGAALKAVTNAYSWVLIPVEDRAEERDGGKARLALRPLPLGNYPPGKSIAPMVWDSLTAKVTGTQGLLKDLTPQTFLERYGRRAWPEAENWVTTTQLWERFTSQVGLPILAKDQVLLEMLRLGEYEGLFAIGLLLEVTSPREQRDSYVHLHYKDTLPGNIPLIGDRWLVMRPSAYHQIANQPEHVQAADIVTAFTALGGNERPVPVQALHNYVAQGKRNNIDEASFQAALTAAFKENQLDYQVNDQPAAQVVTHEDGSLAGELVKRKSTTITPPKSGKTITVGGTLTKLDEFTKFYKSVLQPVYSQKPSTVTIEITVRAAFDEDPGSGLDAALDDGLDGGGLPGVKRIG